MKSSKIFVGVLLALVVLSIAFIVLALWPSTGPRGSRTDVPSVWTKTQIETATMGKTAKQVQAIFGEPNMRDPTRATRISWALRVRDDMGLEKHDYVYLTFSDMSPAATVVRVQMSWEVRSFD